MCDANTTSSSPAVLAGQVDSSMGAGRGPASPPLRDKACPQCAAGTGLAEPAFVYAVGQVEARFPKLGVEKEFAQVAGRSDTAGKTDREVLHAVLSNAEHRYLARQMCWMFTIQGLDTYLLVPRDPVDVNQLVAAIRPRPAPNDVDVVVGLKGPIAPPDVCNGVMVPIVIFDQLYSFDREALLASIPRPKGIPSDTFGATARELFDRIIRMTDNAGGLDDHRALNYLAVRYPAVYARAAESFSRDFSLTAVTTRRWALGTTRRIVEVVFAFTNRSTDFTEKFSVRVDVGEEFPFLLDKLGPYYDK
jgi:hypothetical protein